MMSAFRPQTAPDMINLRVVHVGFGIAGEGGMNNLEVIMLDSLHNNSLLTYRKALETIDNCR